jgi:chromosome segregation ATPase
LREILRLRTSSHEANHEVSELRQKLHNVERTSEERQNELNTCTERLHVLEDELQQIKYELNELKSGMADMELLLEGSETGLKAAQCLLGEYALKISQLEVWFCCNFDVIIL